MTVEEDVSPGRRVGIAERGAGEPHEQAACRNGVAGGLKRLPVGLGFHPAADPVLGRRERELDYRDDEKRQRHRRGLTHAPASPARPHQDPRPRKREEGEPGEPLRNVVTRVVADLVGEDDAHLGFREAAVDHRAPEDNLAGGAKPDGERIRLTRRPADVLDRDRDARDALLPFERRCRTPQGRILERRRLADEIRLGERKCGSDRDEHARARNPPCLAEAAGEKHDHKEGGADRDERSAQLEPVAECPIQIAQLTQVVAAGPPEVEQAEGELHEPDDPEPEHAEQHAGADWPGCGLADEAHPAAGVDPERRNECDLLHHPGDKEEALDAHCFVNKPSAEDRADVHGSEVQAGRYRGVEEQRGAPQPGCGCADDGDRSDEAGQAGSIPRGSSSSSSCSFLDRSQTAGAE